MKRVLAVVLALCLLAPCAYAAGYDISYYTWEYNLNTVITGANKLPEGGYTFDGQYYTWTADDGEITGFILDEDTGKIQTGFCVCSGESKIGDFLSRCATIAFTLDTVDDLASIYLCLLGQYFKAKSGEENRDDFIRSGVAMNIDLLNDGKYLFIFTNVLL